MTDITAALKELGLSKSQLADMLGYRGPHRSDQIYKMEIGERKLMPCQKRLLDAYLSGYRPDDWPKDK